MYLHELLTDEVQTEIEKALRQYNRTEKSRVAGHNEIIKKQVADKQRQIDALMGNLSAGVLPPEVVKEIGEKITILKQGKEVLATVAPPRDFTTE